MPEADDRGNRWRVRAQVDYHLIPMSRVISLGFLGCVAVASIGCFNPGDADEGTSAAADTTAGAMPCMLGDLRACTCPDGSASTRACLPDGSDFGACDCGGAGTGVTTVVTDTGATTSVDESTGAPATDGGSTGTAGPGTSGGSTDAGSTGAGGCSAMDECSDGVACPSDSLCVECSCVAAASLYGPCDSCEPGEVQATLQEPAGYCFCSPPCDDMGVCPSPGTGADAQCAVMGMDMTLTNCVLVCTDDGQCPTGTQCVLVPSAMASICTAPV